MLPFLRVLFFDYFMFSLFTPFLSYRRARQNMCHGAFSFSVCCFSGIRMRVKIKMRARPIRDSVARGAEEKKTRKGSEHKLLLPFYLPALPPAPTLLPFPLALPPSFCSTLMSLYFHLRQHREGSSSRGPVFAECRFPEMLLDASIVLHPLF